MAAAQDLNKPEVYAEALARAAMEPDAERLAAWLAGVDDLAKSPFWKWYLYFAERLQEMAPRPESAFRTRGRANVATPKVGRNDPCPCGSGKKFKACHLGDEEAVAWKLGSPTPEIRAAAISLLIQKLPLATLRNVDWQQASELARIDGATRLQQEGDPETALRLLKTVLDGARDDPRLLFDFWVARYAEWLVEAERHQEAEDFLLDEYDHPKGVTRGQVAQKLAAFYLDQGDPDNADTWVESALEEEPTNPFNHYLKGLLNHSLDHFEEAVASYEQAKSLSDRFREQERVYMQKLVEESLQAARNRERLDEDKSVEAAEEE
ncbi:MAG: SEC-C domain-containing protein [Magnetococcales bacterium]|nr:SEC-C domain-containing protein [Magnetococcales bacterium]